MDQVDGRASVCASCGASELTSTTLSGIDGCMGVAHTTA
jgi:hypothetical protein